MNVTPRVWLAGFLLLGTLVGLLGSVIVVWQYHIDVEPQLIGLHFLALNAGYVFAAAFTQQLVRWIAPRSLAIAASALAMLSLAALSLVGPPAPASWRLAGLASIGVAGGALATSLLYGPADLSASGFTFHRAAALFGSGSLLATLIVGLAYFVGSIQIEGPLLALIPAVYILILLTTGRSAHSANCAPSGQWQSQRQTPNDLRRIATVLLALLLFFQFGNEWAIAGWLPLFLIHRLGTSPALAILILAAYFLVLLLGRLAALTLLPKVNHRRLLTASIITAMLGYLLLSLTASLAEAGSAVLLIGLGFGPIYPLAAQRLGERFAYHPAIYNGITCFAITGAMSAPWILGFVDASLGIRYVMLLPALGSVVVLGLTLLIMFEAHLMADRSEQRLS